MKYFKGLFLNTMREFMQLKSKILLLIPVIIIIISLFFFYHGIKYIIFY